MNRRQFTASLAALAGSATLPFTAVRAAVAAPAATAAIPPTTYAWAHLIVRAQAKANPAMLSRHLNLSAQAADRLFQQLIHDGVLQAPGAAGMARAVAPLDTTATSSARHSIRERVTKAWDVVRSRDDTVALVNPDDPALGCGQTPQEEAQDACTDESLQESTRGR